jgi:large subunit ribosomal protein L25
LEIEGEKQAKKCVIKEIQRDPVTGNFLHVDFLGVKMGEKIIVNVPLVLKGTAPGIKAGGIVEHLFRELEIECFPRHLPERLEVDVSTMEIGDSIHIKDLAFENIQIIDDPDETVVILEAPRVIEEEAAEEVEEELTEPEVIGEKKPEEEEGQEKSQES